MFLCSLSRADIQKNRETLGICEQRPFTFHFHLWLPCVSVAVHGLSVVADSMGSSPVAGGSSLRWLLLLQSLGSRRVGFGSCGPWALGTGAVVVAHRLSCFKACEVFLDRAWVPWPLRWQAGFSFTVPPGGPHLLFVLQKQWSSSSGWFNSGTLKTYGIHLFTRVG